MWVTMSHSDSANVAFQSHCFEDDDLVLRTHIEEEARFRSVYGSGKGMSLQRSGSSDGRGTHAGESVASSGERKVQDDHSGNSSLAVRSQVNTSQVEEAHRSDSYFNNSGLEHKLYLHLKDHSMLSGLKHRMLAYILRDAQSRDRKMNRKDAVRNFFSHFDSLCDLYFIRAQFLGRRHLLIRLSGFDAITSRSTDAAQQTAYFVL